MRIAFAKFPRAVPAALAVAVALAGCAKQEPPAEPVRPVTLVRVAPGGGADVAVFAGEVKPRYESDLGFRIAGKVVSRLVDVGTRVKRGQVLARLDPADVGLQADAAKAQVAAAETEYRYARAEYDRYQNLLAQKFVSESALDQKRNAFEANRAKLEQAKAQLAVSQNQAGYATLVAPDDAVVTAVTVEAGQVVAAGQPVLRLAREEQREIAISVPENRIALVAGNRPLAVVLWANPRKFYTARVREIAPAVDPVTRTFAVRVGVADPDPAMQWGMTANVVVRGEGAPQSMLLPLTSLYRQDGKPAVWIYDAGTQQVALRPIVVGQYREDGIVVTSGVAAGEWVVGAGVHKLRPGQKVRPYDAGGATVPATPGAPAAPAEPATPAAAAPRA